MAYSNYKLFFDDIFTYNKNKDIKKMIERGTILFFDTCIECELIGDFQLSGRENFNMHFLSIIYLIETIKPDYLEEEIKFNIITKGFSHQSSVSIENLKKMCEHRLTPSSIRKSKDIAKKMFIKFSKDE